MIPPEGESDIVIIVEGSSAQRGAIAARLAAQLGVACFADGELPCGLAECPSCVITADEVKDDVSGCLRVLLHDGDAQPGRTVRCHLCLDAQLLGVNGSAELLKQFAVQRLMRRRASSRRV